MAYTLQPWQVLRAAIEFLGEENPVLLEQLDERRVRLTDDQRRRLAVANKAAGKRDAVGSRLASQARRDQMGSAVKAGTRSAGCREGDRRTPRIEGALANLGHHVARTTVANILTRNVIDPAPERGSRTSWRTFLGPHWSTIAAIDFTTVEVWGRHGLATMYVLFAIELRDGADHRA